MNSRNTAFPHDVQLSPIGTLGILSGDLALKVTIRFLVAEPYEAFTVVPSSSTSISSNSIFPTIGSLIVISLGAIDSFTTYLGPFFPRLVSFEMSDFGFASSSSAFTRQLSTSSLMVSYASVMF